MSVRPVTYYEVVCDEPGCGKTTSDLGGDFSAWSDNGAALDEWVNSDGILTEDEQTFCYDHRAGHLCDECGEVKHECQCDPEDGAA